MAEISNFCETTFKPNYEQIKTELVGWDNYLATIEEIAKRKNIPSRALHELLLYDMADAILSNQILLFDEKQISHSSYLIPLLVVYKMSPTFKHFTIVIKDETKISKFKHAIDEIAKGLHLDIDIHYLEPEEAFLCLERLQKKSKGKGSDYRKIYDECLRKKDKGRRGYWNLPAKKWHKIQVHHCHAATCEFFSRCSYALQYQEINRNGCTIIRHRDFTNENTSFNSVNPDTNFVVIAEAQDFIKSVKRKCEQTLSVSLLTSYIGLAKSYIIRKGQTFDDQKILLLREVFWSLMVEFEKGSFQITEETKTKIELLLSFLNELQDCLLKLGISSDNSNNNIILRHLQDISEVFKDMISQKHKYSYYFEPIVGNDDILNKFNVVYYPNDVKEIVRKALARINCSVAFIGSDIAGDDNEYREITSECGLDGIPKTLVKEYTKKDN